MACVLVVSSNAQETPISEIFFLDLGIAIEPEQGNEKSLQPNTHSYNQKHTITVFVKYTRNALQITRLSQTNKSNALTCMESTNQHNPGDSIISTYVSIPTAWPRS